MSVASPPGPLSSVVLPLLSCSGYWVLLSLLLGGVANHLPARWLCCLPLRQGGPDAPGIRHWKRWLPDAGAALPGGLRKAALTRADPALLEQLICETQRAELVHGLLWAGWLPTALWLPPQGVLLNLLFATLFNLPCLVLQRHNRRRVQRALLHSRTNPKLKASARQHQDPGSPPVQDPRHGRQRPSDSAQPAPQNNPGAHRTKPGGAMES